eukprot:GSA25T00025507001.1
MLLMLSFRSYLSDVFSCSSCAEAERELVTTLIYLRKFHNRLCSSCHRFHLSSAWTKGRVLLNNENIVAVSRIRMDSMLRDVIRRRLWSLRMLFVVQN